MVQRKEIISSRLKNYPSNFKSHLESQILSSALNWCSSKYNNWTIWTLSWLLESHNLYLLQVNSEFQMYFLLREKKITLELT